MLNDADACLVVLVGGASVGLFTVCRVIASRVYFLGCSCLQVGGAFNFFVGVALSKLLGWAGTLWVLY